MNTLICLLAMGIANPPPALDCPAPIANKGDMKAGPPLTHTFYLTHKGTGILSITKVEAGCGCMRQEMTAGVLQPGETSKLTIEVNSLTQPDGPNRWQISVGYKVETAGAPPQAGELLLQITAALSREVSVTPPQLAFSTSGAATQILSVTDTRTKPLTVTKAAASSQHLTVEVGPRQAGKPQSVTVKLAADAPVGHTNEMVTLLTDDPDYPQFRVPVRVLKRVAGAVTVNPESIAIRFVAGQPEISTLVQLRAPDGKPIGVASADSDHPGVSVKWSPGTGPVATVRVTVAESAVTATGSSKVRVQLSESIGEVVIPLMWTGGKKER